MSSAKTLSPLRIFPTRLARRPSRPSRQPPVRMILLATTLFSAIALGATPTIPLTGLDGRNGFRVDGVTAGDGLGRSISAAGDINADGIDDLVVSASAADPNGVSNAGSTFVLFGRGGSFAPALTPSSLDGSNGFRINGVSQQDSSGDAVSSGGDFNGDGIDDVAIGARGADPNGLSQAGSTYVVFGRANGFGATLNLSSLNGSNGFRIDGGAAGDSSGTSVSVAGDINDDGIDDLVIGADRADPNGASTAGSSFVVFGRATGFGAVIALSNLDGSNGFRIDGATANDRSGSSVNAAGDINGDGVDDLIIGAPQADPNGLPDAGSSYVVYGRHGAFAPILALSSLDGLDGFRLDGVAAGDLSGTSVAAAGDLNGDGRDDLVIGANGATPIGTKTLLGGSFTAGSVFVVYGRPSGFPATLPLVSLDGANGFRLDGEVAPDNAGYSVAAAGDVNGDHVDDLIVGAIFASPGNVISAGSGYVIFGQKTEFAATRALANLGKNEGFRLDGIAQSDNTGGVVAGGGDFNGDGIDDVVLSADQADPNGLNFAGSAYIVFGLSRIFRDGFDGSSSTP
jgi:hypothetical protein